MVPSPLYLRGDAGWGGVDMTTGPGGSQRGVTGWFPVHCTYLGGVGGGAGHDLGDHRGVWPGDDVVGHNVLSCRTDIIIRGNAGSTVLI